MGNGRPGDGGDGYREAGDGVEIRPLRRRIGLLYLRQGRWQDKRLLPAEFVAMVGKTPPEVANLPVLLPDTYPGASAHYGLLWWNNNDGTLKSVPRDAYWAWGLGDSLIVVIPSLDLVISRAGKAWDPSRSSGYAKLAPFLEPIVASVKDAPAMTRPEPRVRRRLRCHRRPGAPPGVGGAATPSGEAAGIGTTAPLVV